MTTEPDDTTAIDDALTQHTVHESHNQLHALYSEQQRSLNNLHQQYAELSVAVDTVTRKTQDRLNTQDQHLLRLQGALLNHGQIAGMLNNELLAVRNLTEATARLALALVDYLREPGVDEHHVERLADTLYSLLRPESEVPAPDLGLQTSPEPADSGPETDES